MGKKHKHNEISKKPSTVLVRTLLFLITIEVLVLGVMVGYTFIPQISTDSYQVVSIFLLLILLSNVVAKIDVAYLDAKIKSLSNKYEQIQ